MMLSVKEFAAYIGVHPRTVYRRIWEHRQPGVHRFGRDLRIDLDTALQESQPAFHAHEVTRPALGGLFTRA